jgi:hypothetical protein
MKQTIVLLWFGFMLAVAEPPPPALPAFLFAPGPPPKAIPTQVLPTVGPGTPEPTREPTPVPDPDLHFGSLRLAAKGTWMDFSMPDPETPGTVLEMEPLFVIRWYPGIGKDGLLDDDIGIAYEDRQGRTVVWVHAGGGMAFTEMRNAFELGPYSEVRPSDMVGGMVGGLIGEPAAVTEGGTTQAATLTAAARLTPEEVDGLEQSWMDVPAYVSSLYPAAYFDSVLSGDRFLLVVFCGRPLGDRSTPNVPWYSQARFVLALRADG